MSTKEMVIDAVRDLPEGATFDEILEHVAILAAICQGQQDAKAGRVISHEKIKERVVSWNATH
jgi:predicted transcriptional regulator